MFKSKPDWRANIKNVDNLYDIDPAQMMIFLRHQYLDSAKDLMLSIMDEDWEFGEQCCQAAEALEQALEAQAINLENFRY